MRILRYWWLPGLLLAALGLARPWLEAGMALHMALELPALFALGWLAAHGARVAFAAAPALLAALSVSAFWMLPVALDLAVLDPRIGLLKVLSMLLAGALAGGCWRRAGLVVQAFAVFNGVWMMLSAGLLYQDAPQQLCSVYLGEQQWAAGAALVALAVAVLGLWLGRAWVRLAAQDGAGR